MNGALVVAPVLVPLLGVLVTLLAWRRPGRQARLSLACAMLFAAAATALLSGTVGGQVFEARFGDWPAPAAIAFSIDRLGAAMLTVSGVVLVAVLLFPVHWRRPRRPRAVAASNAARAHDGRRRRLSSADLFNLYVWFEVMLISALGVIVIGARREHLEAGLKYLVLNLVGTVMLLIAVGGIYGLSGQLNFAAIGVALDRMGEVPLAQAYVALLLISLLIKAGAFPFFSGCRLPIQTCRHRFSPLRGTPHQGRRLCDAAGGGTDRGSAGGRPARGPGLDRRRHHAGGRARRSAPLGYAPHPVLPHHQPDRLHPPRDRTGHRRRARCRALYTLHHIVVKANLFLIGGLVRRVAGSHDLRHAGGVFRSHPWLAALFAIPAASLVGVPLLSGFWAKLLVVRECFAGGDYLWGGAALLVGGLTLYSMLKLWIEAFWKPRPEGSPEPSAAIPARAWLACGGLAAITLAIGAPQPLLDFSMAAVSAMPLAGGSR